MRREHAIRGATPAPWLNRTVFLCGVASLMSDAGHEMATAVLPLFLVTIGGSAGALGLIEGVADGLSTGAKLLSGWYSDGLARRRSIGTLGYAATGLGMAAFALARNPFHALIVRGVSWFGRGMRGPVRDAMIAEAVPAESYGRAFGFHRAMDTAGAVVGPLLALALMRHVDFRTIFALTLIPGVLSVVAFGAIDEVPRVRRRDSLRASLGALPARYRWFLVAVGIFGLGDFARSLLILRVAELLDRGGHSMAPALTAVSLYVGHNLVHALSAYGIGVLATRYRAARLLCAGYACFAAMAIGFIVAPAVPSVGYLALLFLLAGLAMSAQEVLEGTVAAEMLPPPIRGTGYGALAAVNGIGDLAASAVVGWLWSTHSPEAGFVYAAAMAIGGTIALFGLA